MSDLTSYTSAIAICVGILVALIRFYRQKKFGNVERTIAFHRDITTGEVGDARDRFTEYMWQVGSDAGESNQCYQPSWAELLNSKYSDNEGLVLSRYPDSWELAPDLNPLTDLYRVMWCFERISVADRNGLLDRKLTAKMLQSHAVWWDTLCENIPNKAMIHREGLSELASSLSGRALPNRNILQWARDDFSQHRSSSRDAS